LLIPTRELLHARLRPGVDGKAIDRRPDPFPFVTSVDEAPTSELVDHGQRDVLAHRALRQQRQGTVGGHEHQARSDRIVRMAELSWPVLDQDLAAVRGPIPAEAFEKIRLALALQGDAAEDPASLQRERRIL